jgi:hypothetical protein
MTFNILQLKVEAHKLYSATIIDISIQLFEFEDLLTLSNYI